MIPHTTIAYLTGFLEADGTIGIRRFKNSTGQLHYRPMIEVVNTKKPIIDLFTKIFSNSSLFDRHNAQRMKNKQWWVWRVTGTNCIPILETMLPYMTIKQTQAKLCFKMAKRIGKRGQTWSPKFRKKENSARRKLYLAIRHLNGTL